MAESRGYRVRVRVEGELDPAWWSDEFGSLRVAPARDDTTLIAGEVQDQAALHGLLAAIRDLGLNLVSIEATNRGPCRCQCGGSGG